MRQQFGEQVDIHKMDTTTAALGAVAGENWTVKEVGKCVSLEAASADCNYKLAANTDDIEAICTSVEPGTVNGGFSVGTVQKNGRARAVVTGAPLAVKDQVVCAAQIAVGTVGLAQVKAGTGVIYKWRVLDLLGSNGGIGTTILIERC